MSLSRRIVITLNLLVLALLLAACQQDQSQVVATQAVLEEVAAVASEPDSTDTRTPQPSATAIRSVNEPTTSPQPSPTPTPITFRTDFDDRQSDIPEPFDPPGWDVVVHSRNPDTWQELQPVDAAHGPNCEKPPAVHEVTDYADAVYACRGHLMTAIRADGYGLIYVTPNYMVDFRDGPASIRFDISTLRTSGRDWWDVWITPYEDNLVAPLEDFLPDLNGEPRRAVQVRLGLGNNNVLDVDVFKDHNATRVDPQVYKGYEAFLEPDALNRTPIEIQISQDHVRVGMPEQDVWWVDAPIELDWDTGVVQFGHHSYNPTKDGGTANTWHWDNIEISPALPFEIIDSQDAAIGTEQADVATFERPAPQDAHLRFAAAGEDIEVSFDDGATWQPAVQQAQEKISPMAFANYWMPIPAGTERVRFRAEDAWYGEWRVWSVSVWARSPETGETETS